MGVASTFYQIYFKSTGYSYTNLGRMFLRMFVGLMLAQFGVRQLMGDSVDINGLTLISSGLSTWLVITVELFCSFCIMIGFLTRLMILPPFTLMICSLCCPHQEMIESASFFPGIYMITPFLFMGIYFFLLVVGPGKISIDYFLSLYLINRQKGSEEDLEVV